MLHQFLVENEAEVLALTARKALQITGVRPTSEQLERGLPVFYKQLLEVLRIEESAHPPPVVVDEVAMARAAGKTDEPALAMAAGRPHDAELARAAGVHGTELLRLGYTLSHVVHAYGSMCQAITELASKKQVAITASEFHDLNRCLDVAIAGAVTQYQFHRNTELADRETEHLGSLAHELRNALSAINISLQLIRKGAVGFEGSTGGVLDKGLKRMEVLIDRSLTEVRLRVDPKVHLESGNLLHLVNQIVVTAEVEARARNQILEVHVDSAVTFEADQQLLYSAVFNLIQNALKYTPTGGKIQIRGRFSSENIVIEIEDQCGGLKTDVDLFKPFEQKHEDRKGLGLGLTIARRGIMLNHGTIEVKNLPGVGCIFTIKLPRNAGGDLDARLHA